MVHGQMNRGLRHLALLLLGAGLFLAAILTLRPAPLAPLPRATATAAGPTPALPAAAAEAVASDRALAKEAEQKLSRLAPPIAAAPAATAGDARFLLRDRNVSAFFTPRGISLAILGRAGGGRPSPTSQGWGLHWGISGARAVEPRPEGEQAAKVNVLKGPESEWQVDQKTYARMVYDEIKPGLRMTVETAARGVKYSLSAAKASEVEALRLRYEGAAAIRAAQDGKSLEIHTGGGSLREDGLIVTQEGRPIEATYRVTGQDQYAIVLHGADPAKPVEVDPVIGWSSFLGGTQSSGGGSEYPYSVKVDAAGSMYVAGGTYSADFPGVTGNFDSNLGGYQDGFVIKLNAAGAVVWATYLGGSNYDEIRSLAIDGASPPNVYVTGYTDSSDFPIVGTVPDSSWVNTEVFVSRINGNGLTLNWSTFLGGDNSEYGRSLAVDAAGTSVWVAGYTFSVNFPTFAGFDNSYGGSYDGFITKLGVAVGPVVSITYSSFVGGTSDDLIEAIAVDGTGAAYLTGYTFSSDFPLAGASYDPTWNGGYDVFVVKVKPAGTGMDWATYFGGSSDDVAQGLALGPADSVFIVGYSYSLDYPTTTSYSVNNGSADIILTKLTTNGVLGFSSYLGGPDHDAGYGVVVNGAGEAITTGVTYNFSGIIAVGNNPGYPMPYNWDNAGSGDLLMTGWQAVPPPGGFPLNWQHFIGGSSYDQPYAMAIDASNTLYIVGETSSLPGTPNTFPLTGGPNPPPFDGTLGSYEDAFIIRFPTTPDVPVVLTYGSYIGGENQVGDDYGRKAAFDASGNIYVTGYTYSSNFPTAGGPFQASPGVLADCTVTKYSNAANPTLLWSTYLGGDSHEEPAGIGTDPVAGPTLGQVYVGGRTISSNFPTTIGPAPAGGYDFFITKLLAGGNGLAWSQRIGGSSSETARAMAVNGAGDVVLVGSTSSTNYPATLFAYQTVSAGSTDAVAVLVTTGGAVSWASYLGGTASDIAFGAAFNFDGTRVYLGGTTSSTNFPTTAGVQQPANAGSTDFFVTRLNPGNGGVIGAAQLEMSTYYGSTASESTSSPDIAVDPSGNVYFAGDTSNSLFPTTIGPVHGGGTDTALLKFNPAGVRQWARFLGGSGTDSVRQIRVDALGSLYVVGSTTSINFPVQGAFQASLAGGYDVYVTKLDTTGTSLDWSSYLGGTNTEFAYGLGLGSGGAVIVVGDTSSSDFPRVNPIDNVLNGQEFFVTRIDNSNPSTPSLLAQTKLGGASLSVGAWSNEASFIAKATLGDLDDDTVALQVEVRSIDAPFTNTPSATGVLGAGGPNKEATVAFPGGTQQFHWQARTIDVHGRVSSWVSFGGNSDGTPPTVNAARDLGRDITAPSIAMLTPTTGTSYTTASSPIQFTGSFTDPGGTAASGVSSVSWSISPGGQSGGATLNSPVTGQWTIGSIPLSIGVNNVTLSVTDSAGNTPANSVITVTYDTTAPSTTITGPTTPGVPLLTGTGTSTSQPPTGTVTLTGNSADNNFVSSVTWSNSTGGSGSVTLNPGTTNRTWQPLNVPVSPGANTITVITYDGANNPSLPSQIVVNYDNQPPVVGISSHANNYTTLDPTLTLVGSASDQAAPYSNSISSVTWTNNGGSPGTTTLGVPGAGQWTSSSITLAAGANVLVVTATDGVPLATRSNLNLGSTSITVYKDVAAPVITITSPALTSVTTGNGSITISGTATDDQNVVSVSYTNSLALPTVFPVTPLSGPVNNRTWSVDVPLISGVNNLVFTSTDIVGRTHTDSIAVTYDTNGPSILVNNPSTATSVVSVTPFLALNGTAAASGGKTVTGVTVENLTTGVLTNAGTTNWTANVDLVIGTNTIQIIASDSGMPSISTTVNRTIIYDPTAPAVTITGPTGADTYASPVNTVVLSGVATDNRAVATVKWSNLTTGILDQNATLTPGPVASLTWTTSAIPLQPGANNLRIRATDEANLITDDLITVTYDTSSPGITITSPTSAPTTTTTATTVALGGNASDNFQIQSVTWINTATGLSGPATPPLTAWGTPSIALNPGANVITLIAIDAAGNTQSDSITVYRDDAAPAITITSPTSDSTLYTATDSITLGGTASDDIVVAQVTWSTDRVVVPTSGPATGTTNWSIASIPLAPGSNIITVSVSDGIRPAVTDVITVVYDNVNPVVDIDVPATAAVSTTTTPASLEGTATDNQGVTEVTWTNTTTGGSGTASGTGSWSCLTPLTSGANVIQVTARDAAGNSHTQTVTVTYDPAAPLITITAPTTGISIVTNTTPVTVSGTASDDVGVATVTWSNNGSTPVLAGGSPSNWTFNAPLSAGDNVITVVATDGVGRTGTAFLTVVYDPAAPTVTILTPTTDTLYRITQPTVSLTGVANDNLSLQSVVWSNAATAAGGNTNGTGAWSVPSAALVEGPNLFTITATDGVNNVGADTITVSYDATDPLLAIDPPNPLLATWNGTEWDTSTRPFPLSGTASDNFGLTSVNWVNTRSGPGSTVLGSGSATLTAAGGGFTWSAPIYFVLGINTVTFTATDDHGRTATAQIAFNYIPEGSAPLISILTPPPPTAVSATQVVSLTGDSTDNVGVVAVTWRNTTTRIRGDAVPTGPGGAGPPPNYSTWSADIPLTRGANVIVVTAVDDAGNTATASITVTYSPAGMDTTDPVVTIQLPSNTGNFAAASSPITLSVDATDVGDGVAAVTWTNTGTTGAGGLSPGTAPDQWTGSIALSLGTNVIKVTVADASGNTATDTIVVTFAPAAPDGNPPTITIQTPPPAVQYATSVGTVTVTGIASDATAVATVVFLNGATLETGSADGTTAWTAEVTLDSGINLLTFTVYDVYGFTQTAQLTAVYTPPPPPPEIVPAGSCGLLGLDALLFLAALAVLRRYRMPA